MDRRAELEGWIARTQRNQRTLGYVVGGAAAVAIGLALWNSRLGMLAFAVIAIVALCGFWVTSSHIADWRGKLEVLEQTQGKPPRTVGRRS